ncbi:sigma-70 family RNA polymerase sigma factor [Fulvimonas yonginensis]|uniref:Sigma-70 family RNA polymerase sigma factor n=1 Tax=Fulvimonas yonginensis TaxID=1495200 RepID=A0ABU8JE59_9GAMM
MLLTVDSPERELWHRWIGQRERMAREALIQMHASWARLVAKDVYLKVRIKDAEWGDYVQNATVGLIEAIDRYEPGRGVDFRTYARHRVRGAVFNGLRHLASQSFGCMDAMREERSASLSSDEADPLLSFVSWTVGLGIGHLLETASLHDDRQQGEDPYANASRDQVSALLHEAVKQLPEREKFVLTLHYFQHVPFVEIASELGLTKGRVSQIHRQAIQTLRVHIRASLT